ncbi:MAG: nucleotidyltransferase domain-containing protein [Thiovulaceae bacterium]|jgi:predicted nucleotidyltransferase|nr:nucleotidyltransferase domain-containing protein [Sulfurimonadaceae bacterium]
MNKNEIITYLKNHKDEFAKKYQITRLALFGSVAKETNREGSDIDIAIDTKMSNYFLLYDFKEDLEKAFGTKVDVVRIRETMNPYLKKRILREGIYV